MGLIKEIFKQPGRGIGLIVVISDIFLITLMVFVSFPKDSQDILGMAVGGLTTKSMQIISFYFGSSDATKNPPA